METEGHMSQESNSETTIAQVFTGDIQIEKEITETAIPNQVRLVAKIVKYTIETSAFDSSEFVSYHIRVRIEDDNMCVLGRTDMKRNVYAQWIVMRRYSEFLNLYNQLMSSLISREHQIVNFPGKLYGKSKNFNHFYIEKRKNDLQAFLQALLSAEPVWFRKYGIKVKKFLEIDYNLAKIVADKCTVTLSIAQDKLSQMPLLPMRNGGKDVGGIELPDWHKAMEEIIEEKVKEVLTCCNMEQNEDNFNLCKTVLFKYKLIVKRAVKELNMQIKS
jgi:hypothetical protein